MMYICAGHNSVYSPPTSVITEQTNASRGIIPLSHPMIKKWWKLRYTLIPYIVEQSRKAIASGAPLLQALIFHHPEDKLCWHIDDEYYFGNDFLVAPVMNSENRRDVYLPEGTMGEFLHW